MSTPGENLWEGRKWSSHVAATQHSLQQESGHRWVRSNRCPPDEWQVRALWVWAQAWYEAATEGGMPPVLGLHRAFDSIALSAAKNQVENNFASYSSIYQNLVTLIQEA